jgi:hypothetical protein
LFLEIIAFRWGELFRSKLSDFYTSYVADVCETMRVPLEKKFNRDYFSSRDYSRDLFLPLIVRPTLMDDSDKKAAVDSNDTGKQMVNGITF